MMNVMITFFTGYDNILGRPTYMLLVVKNILQLSEHFHF